MREDTLLEIVLKIRMALKRRHHAHTAEDDDPPRKRFKQESDEEYVPISTLTRTVTHGSKDWLIDNGDSKNIT